MLASGGPFFGCGPRQTRSDNSTEVRVADESSGLQGGGGGARGINVPASVCHEYTEDGHFAYVTLGPGAGGLIVVDIQASEPTVVKARGTSNAILINSRSHRVVHEIDFVGDSPDILDFSPDGRIAFVSLRGPNPVTGAAHVATGSTPGFAVINTAQRRKVRLIQPAELEELESSDFHGLGVRVIP